MNMQMGSGVNSVTLPRGVNILSARQAKAARSVLGLSVGRLAGQAGISESTIRRVEDGRDGAIKVDMVLRLQAFFEHRGFTFLWEEGERGLTWSE